MAVVTPDIYDLLEEAYERCGSQLKSGWDLKTARRSLNLLLLEWQNRGLNLWTINEQTVSVVSGTATYTLATDTIDIVEAVLRDTNNQDVPIARVGINTYSSIPDKTLTGTPRQMYIERLATSTRITLYPVPDADWTFVYWRLTGIDGVDPDTGGAGVGTLAGIPPRFVPALTAGLAYYLSQKIPEALERVLPLKDVYEEAFALAAEEDREKISTRLVPGGCY
jgi:hypothetical protein